MLTLQSKRTRELAVLVTVGLAGLFVLLAMGVSTDRRASRPSHRDHVASSNPAPEVPVIPAVVLSTDRIAFGTPELQQPEVSSPADPAYLKTVRAILSAKLDNASDEERNEACERLAGLLEDHPSCLEEVTKWLAKGDEGELATSLVFSAIARADTGPARSFLIDSVLDAQLQNNPRIAACRSLFELGVDDIERQSMSAALACQGDLQRPLLEGILVASSEDDRGEAVMADLVALESVAVRENALPVWLEALAHSPQAPREVIAPYLSDADDAVRQAAVNALRHRSDSTELIRMLITTEPLPSIRRSMVEVLADQNALENDQLLRDIASFDRDPAVRRLARRSLG